MQNTTQPRLNGQTSHLDLNIEIQKNHSASEPRPPGAPYRRVGVWAYRRTQNVEIVGEASRFAPGLKKKQSCVGRHADTVPIRLASR